MNRFIFILVLLMAASLSCYSQIIGDSTDIIWEKPNEGSIYGLCFSPNDSLIAVAKVGSINILRAKDGEFLNDLKADQTFWTVSFSPDGRFLAATTGDGFIYVWTTYDWKVVYIYDNKELLYNINNQLKFNKDSKLLFAPTRNKGITVFNTTTWKVENTYTNFPYIADSTIGGKKDVNSLDLTNDGNKVVFSDDKITYLFNMQNNNIENHFWGTFGKITKDGKYLATVKIIDPYIRHLIIYDVASGLEIMKVEYSHSLFWFDFSADSKFIAVSSEDENKGLIVLSLTQMKIFKYYNIDYKKRMFGRAVINNNQSNILTFTKGIIYNLVSGISFSSIEYIKNDTLIYPNPVKDILKLFLKDNFIKENVAIVDIKGNQVSSKSFSYTITDDYLQIDVRSLIPGMYFLNISDKYYKFIKE